MGMEKDNEKSNLLLLKMQGMFSFCEEVTRTRGGSKKRREQNRRKKKNLLFQGLSHHSDQDEKENKSICTFFH